jgi:hypothetical protein
MWWDPGSGEILYGGWDPGSVDLGECGRAWILRATGGGGGFRFFVWIRECSLDSDFRISSLGCLNFLPEF